MKNLFIDVETTGLSPWKCGIVQIAGFVEIDEEEKETFNIKMRPRSEDDLQPGAMKMHEKAGVNVLDEARLSNYQGYEFLVQVLGNYVDRFDKKDKFHFCGYNSHSFDMPFVHQLFIRQDDKFFRSWFHYPSIDVMLMASFHLRLSRHLLVNFKQSTVAQVYGIEVEEESLHDALYDVRLTRGIYKEIVRQNRRQHSRSSEE